MYTYRMYNRYSTKKSEVLNEQGEVIAYIERTYSNPLMRLLDIVTEGAMFTDYRITDANDKLVVEANQVRTFIKRRQYYITYHSGEGTSKIHLVDKKLLDLGEKTDFEYQGKTYQLNKPLMDWGIIILDGKPLAEWKETLTIPAKANFKLVDPACNEHELLLLGIFHTYLHSPK
ncbi:hypothetical protein [Paenibacillus sp. PL91]|uniref:tubby C-terminal domain-like protein n=1 Tax=Paenibacillus sp. PL91 TaxID=2729538 RepID=UPI00145E6595|nr:hypothetical protein [Paenibacillus sp. PL91]MBC9201348.1 hypothetical protein [Paenibacillus sp. PL91]